MESDQGKLFIGGISWETDENLLREYFSNFGEVSQVTVMRDKATGRPRGFGFVAFSDPAVIDRVLQDKHHIDNRDVDVKRAMSRDEQSPAGRQGSFNGNRSFDSGGAANVRTKKIFVGGLPPALTSDEFRAYFETYGPVSDAVIMIDQATQRPRGFGFVSFDTEDSVDLVLHKTFHDLSGKQVEVKRALPKDANPGLAGGGGRGGSGGFPGYGGSGYEGRVDSSRYMQPQNAGSGYPPYGGAASGYGTTGYGYGSNGVGYGGFGGYGNPSGAPYGNPAGGPGAGFGSGGPRPSWEGQAPSGYGNNVGYGNAAAPAAPWGGSGPGSAVMGQGGASAGYGYGGNDSSYGAQPGYGAVGGRPNSHGGGYGDVSNGSGGYGNHQVNGQAGYGGGYGRQAQQQ